MAELDKAAIQTVPDERGVCMYVWHACNAFRARMSLCLYILRPPLTIVAITIAPFFPVK